MTPIFLFATYACPTAGLVWAHHRCMVANRPARVSPADDGSPVRVLAADGEVRKSHDRCIAA